MMRLVWLFFATVMFTAPALASEPTGSHDGSHGGGHAAHDDHSSSHGDDHGGGHGHHYYTEDDDGDGTPNWLDPKNGFKDNDETYVVTALLSHVFNLAILIGLVMYAARRPLQDLFRERALGIRKSLTDSARRRDEAHQRHQDLVARLDKIQSEVDAIQESAAQEAAQEELKLVERAEREAKRIVEQAGRTIRDEGTRARHQLRKEAVELAVKLAEETLRSKVASGDQRALAEDFLASLRNTENAHG